MTDKSIKWVRQQKSLMPDKPFFMYWAPGAAHAPHHVRPEWSDKHKGKFGCGWDQLRKETFARQKEMGVVPQDAQLTERHEEIPACWPTSRAMPAAATETVTAYRGTRGDRGIERATGFWPLTV
jgi:arylsulfatase